MFRNYENDLKHKDIQIMNADFFFCNFIFAKSKVSLIKILKELKKKKYILKYQD
jgi:hypothetical protein